MKLAYLLALALCIPLCCTAQSKTDSLKTLLATAIQESDFDKAASHLSHIGYDFLTAHEYDSALSCYYRSIRYSTKNPELTASTFECMGVAYNNKGFSDSTLFYYNKALTLYQDAHDTTHVVIIETNLSLLYKNLGLYEKSLSHAFRASTILEKQPPDRTLASCYNTIGAVYAKLKNHTSALLYYHKALAVRKQIDYTKGIGQSYNNIGELYISLRQYDSALLNLFRSVDIKKNIGDRNAVGTTLNLIGETYLALNKVKEAEPFFQESLAIKKQSGERLNEAIALNNLGKVKLLLKDLKAAENYIREAEQHIRITGSLDELRKNLELNVQLYQSRSDYKKALYFANELMIVKDSLLDHEKIESLASMQTQYETEKKEQQISILEQDKALQHAEIKTKQTWIQSLAIIITLTTVIAVLLYYSYRQSQRNQNRVENLLKELHHRVKNNLQVLSSVLSLQSRHLTDENAIQVIKSSESRVNTMALIHKKLYSDQDNRNINMKEYIQELVTYLMHTYGMSDKLTFTLNSTDIYLDVDKAIPAGLILNEIVSNAMKYAYHDHAAPSLQISISTHQPNELTLEISDNGPGIPEAAQHEASQSFGLRMVKTLTRELKGKVSVQSHTGTTFTLQIPVT
jgi:two-component system, sensor histidine kinase PdtaS